MVQGYPSLYNLASVLGGQLIYWHQSGAFLMIGKHLHKCTHDNQLGEIRNFITPAVDWGVTHLKNTPMQHFDIYNKFHAFPEVYRNVLHVIIKTSASI